MVRRTLLRSLLPGLTAGRIGIGSRSPSEALLTAAKPWVPAIAGSLDPNRPRRSLHLFSRVLSASEPPQNPETKPSAPAADGKEEADPPEAEGPHIRALLASNSTLYGNTYFGHCGDVISSFLQSGGATSVLFVPYAVRDHERYFANTGEMRYDSKGQPVDHAGRPRARLSELGFNCTSIHHAKDPLEAVEKAQAIFIGGGNSFLLKATLHSIPGLWDAIRRRVLAGELLYMGSGSGSTLAGATMHAATCMPIVPVPDFEGLGVVPFNITPHYQDPEPKARLKDLGFTVSMEKNREQRIRQYTDEVEHAFPVVGLREGTLLEVNGDWVWLHGERPGRVFRPKQAPVEIPPNSVIEGLVKLD